MKKLLPFLRLVLVCVVLGGASYSVVLLKQGRLYQQTKDDVGPPGEGGDEVHASMPGAGEAGPNGSREAGGGEAVDGAAPASSPEAKRQQAVAAGRALFHVPEPLSIAEASDLMNDLRQQKHEYEARKSALDQRQRELEAMEKELETRRTELGKLADQVQAVLPESAAAKEAAAVVDPETLQKIAGFLDAAQPDVAAKALATYTPERAAQLLLAMNEKKVAAILGQMEPERLTKITEALIKQKGE
jgi:flagellar motility protein MotE (MotC chaperone)